MGRAPKGSDSTADTAGCAVYVVIAIVIFIFLIYCFFGPFIATVVMIGIAFVAFVIIYAYVSSQSPAVYENPAKPLSGRKHYVYNSSLICAELSKLNEKYEEYFTDLCEEKHFKLDSLAKFRRFTDNVEKNVSEYVRDNEEHFRIAVAQSKKLERVANEYKNAFRNICHVKSIVPKKSERPLFVSDDYYRETEKELMKSLKKEIDPTLTIQVEWSYTSPGGRNHYADNQLIERDDIERMLNDTDDVQVARPKSNRTKARRNSTTRGATGGEYTFNKERIDDFLAGVYDLDNSQSVLAYCANGSNDHSLPDFPEFISSEGVDSFPTLAKLLNKLFNHKPSFRDDLKFLGDKTSAYQKMDFIAREYVAKRFPSPQMTYDRFMEELDDSAEAFFKLVCKGADIISISMCHSEKSDAFLGKIKKDVNALSEKLEELSFALVDSYDESDDTDSATRDIETLMEDMQILIDSVKEYE